MLLLLLLLYLLALLSMAGTKPKIFLRTLNEFIKSNNDFKLVYNPEQCSPLVNQTTGRICILDSSFNPPHLGHLSLAIDSLNEPYNITDPGSPQEKVLLLLLSVKNADKLTPLPAALEERIDMMCLMADHLNRTHNVRVGVGLTKHAKFVDKSSSTIKHFARNNKPLKLTFSVGFDTLIRIFNPKYYLPYTLKESLNTFMECTDIFCLTRSDDDSSFQEQLVYVNDIKIGKKIEIPNKWANSIYLKHKQDDLDKLSEISSSNIRKQVTQKNHNWENKVIPEIKDYIKSNNLYSL